MCQVHVSLPSFSLIQYIPYIDHIHHRLCFRNGYQLMKDRFSNFTLIIQSIPLNVTMHFQTTHLLFNESFQQKQPKLFFFYYLIGHSCIIFMQVKNFLATFPSTKDTHDNLTICIGTSPTTEIRAWVKTVIHWGTFGSNDMAQGVVSTSCIDKCNCLLPR